MRRLALASVVMALTLPFLAAAAFVASADEGSSGRQAGASPLIRPPLGVLRHVDAPTASPAALRIAPDKELVVLVGGYQSCACPADNTFDALITRLSPLPGYDVVRFGADPRFPYDSFGPIDASAINLRDQIRSLAPGYTAVHLVTHSMGGVVADRAFTNGLSSGDKVATYVSWSAPHNGSDAARGLALASRLTGGTNSAVREGLLWLDMEPESSAVRDLAYVRASSPPAGVVRLDLREATDVLVTPSDARDPGVPTRTLDRAKEGHGGILTDPDAIDLTMRTIVTRVVPPDERSRMSVIRADAKSEGIGLVVLAAVCALTLALCVFSAHTNQLLRTPLIKALRSFLPRAKRKPCG